MLFSPQIKIKQSDNCEAGFGVDTIELPANSLLSFDEPYIANQSNALPVITEELIINGHGSIIERSTTAQSQFRLIATDSPNSHQRMFKLTLNDLTLRNGALDEQSADSCGGAINIEADQAVSLNQSTVTQNKAINGGGICGSVELIDSTISFNSVSERGGGIIGGRGGVSIANSTISDNSSGASGGGIFAGNSEINISDSVVTRNLAQDGAGIFGYHISNRHKQSYYCNISATTITKSTISGNKATGNGGGINSYCNLVVLESTIAENTASNGAGLWSSQYKHAKILDSTVRGNTAGVEGGGLFGGGSIINSTVTGNTAVRGGGAFGVFSIRNSTVSENTAQSGGGLMGSVFLKHATVVNNQANEGGGIFVKGFYSGIYGRTHSNIDPGNGLYYRFIFPGEAINSVVSGNAGNDCLLDQTVQLDDQINSLDPNTNNWFGDESCDGIASGDAGLASLSDNGGPTLTHALLPNSPLINAADISVCFDRDQRGTPRLDDQLCDIGAFEKTDIPTLPPINQPLILAGSIAIDHRISHISFPEVDAFEQPPVIILGPMSFNGTQPAVTRISQIDDSGFQVRIQEYNYLDGQHFVESIDYLAIQPGVYRFNDPVRGGEIIIEAGFFEVNSRVWHQQKFVADFPESPIILTTVETSRGKDAVTERLRKVTQEGFQTRLFEEEKLQSGGHVLEKVGFIALHLPLKRNNFIKVNRRHRRFEKRIDKFDHTWGNVQVLFDQLQLSVEEERSLDKEVLHLEESINIIKIEDLLFAEDISSRGLDTSSLRKR